VAGGSAGRLFFRLGFGCRYLSTGKFKSFSGDADNFVPVSEDCCAEVLLRSFRRKWLFCDASRLGVAAEEPEDDFIFEDFDDEDEVLLLGVGDVGFATPSSSSSVADADGRLLICEVWRQNRSSSVWRNREREVKKKISRVVVVRLARSVVVPRGKVKGPVDEAFPSRSKHAVLMIELCISALEECSSVSQCTAQAAR
jgi:hypothetical protein